MRALILVAGAALAVSACSSNEAADNTMNVDENLTAENVVADMTRWTSNAADANMTMDAQRGDGRQQCGGRCQRGCRRGDQQRDVIRRRSVRGGVGVLKRLPVRPAASFFGPVRRFECAL